MKKLLFLLLFLPFLGNSQATFTAPVGYNTGAPTATPSGVGTRWRFDLLTGKKYTWLPGSLSWDEDARGIDQVAGCSAPLYTPGYNQSTFAVNSCSPPVLYQWTGAAWEIPNEPEIYTAGTGISIDGSNVITNTSPNIVQTLSIAGQDLTLSGGGGTVEIPAGASDALGTGFTAGGGTGTIPPNTIGVISYPEGVSNTLVFTEVEDPGVSTITETGFIGVSATGLNSKMVLRDYTDQVSPEASQTQVYMQVDDGTNSSKFVISSPTTMLFEAIDGDVNSRLNITGGGINASASNNLTEAEAYFQVTDNVVIFSAVDDSGATDLASSLNMTMNDAAISHSDATNLVASITIGDTGPIIVNDINGLGAQYAADHSATIITNPTSLTDVTSVNLLKQTPVSYTSAAAPNNCIFYSTTLSKLAYKDPGGTVNPLY